VVLGAFSFFAVTVYMSAPKERLATTEFRQLFDGANKGQYPNGTKFSATEIVGTPALTEVFAANSLGQFGRFEDFKDALFIQQSNPELDLLSYEYQAKLADTKLTPVDLARIEEEFRKKRESLSAPQFFRCSSGSFPMLAGYASRERSRDASARTTALAYCTHRCLTPTHATAIPSLPRIRSRRRLRRMMTTIRSR